LIGNEHPKLNLTFIDDKTKHLQKKIPLLFFFGGLPWCENLSQEKNKTVILMHLPQEEILVMINYLQGKHGLN
jgi:hypothetical protein